MTIKTHFVGFDGEKAVDSPMTQTQINAVTALDCALVDPVSGLPPDDLRWANDPSESGTIFQLILWDRRVRIDQHGSTEDAPPFAVLTELDGVVVRLEFYEGHDPLECTYDLRSAGRLRGKNLRRWTERDPHTDDPVAFLVELLGVPREFSKLTLQAIQDPDTPMSAPSCYQTSSSDHPDERMVPTTLLDRRVPQRGWEQEYGVPSYLIGAADVLYHHRKRVASPDIGVIDAAIIRLYGPWMRRPSGPRDVTPYAGG